MVDSDEAAHYEPPYLTLRCLQIQLFHIYVKRGFWGKNPRNSCRTAYNRKIDVIQSLVNNPGTAL